MNRNRIIEILEVYRPGEGLEADPEVRQALAAAAADPELAQRQREIQEFDAAFGSRLRQVDVPAGLQAAIIAAAQKQQDARNPGPPARGRLIAWLHPAAFAAAAAVVILLALSFTYWNRPQPQGAAMAMAADPLLQTAHALYASLRPSFKVEEGKDGTAVLEYLRAQGASLPASLPGGVSWDQSFACDVRVVNGTKVTIVCFRAPDNSRTMHLITFERAAFPHVQVPPTPEVHSCSNCCCARWSDDGNIHVLYSDKGEDNLRKLLRI